VKVIAVPETEAKEGLINLTIHASFSGSIIAGKL
jgi:hypothetical protein